MRSRRAPFAAVLVLALLAGACEPSAPSVAPPPDAAAVVAAITESGLRARLEDLAAATGSEAPYRAVGSAGYDAAADLVERTLRDAGWTVTLDTRTAPTYVDDGSSALTIGDVMFGGKDVLPLVFSPAGEVEGPVVLISAQLSGGAEPVGTATPGTPPPGGDASPGTTFGDGCAPTHYGDLPPDAIVVVAGGDCFRREQILAAQQAGAAAFLAVYPDAPGGVAYRPTLIEPGGMRIPAAGVSGAVLGTLRVAARERTPARLVTTARTVSVATRSVIAELAGADPGRVVMLGAHLDSVLDGPGINDDGSGVAALLELARALEGTRPRATIRLAFWSGEELGLHGSYAYALDLDDDERRALIVYLNADMLASPNGYAGVYDEAGSAAGSNAVRALLVAAVERAGGTSVGVDLGGGSDHRAFREAGIPTGGVYAGSSEPVSPEQAATTDAVAGRSADACYHQPCDDVANANLPLARLLTAALADALVRLANNPELVGR